MNQYSVESTCYCMSMKNPQYFDSLLCSATPYGDRFVKVEFIPKRKSGSFLLITSRKLLSFHARKIVDAIFFLMAY